MSLIEDQERRIAALEAKLARLEMRGPLAGVISQQLASTNSVAKVLRVERTTSGTAADGIGAGIVFVTQDASGNLDEAASIEAVLTTAAHATEAAQIKVYVLGTNALILDSAGNGFILRGLHVGGTSDPGDNNLLVDGTISKEVTWTTGVESALIVGGTGGTPVSSLYHLTESTVTAYTSLLLKTNGADGVQTRVRVDSAGVVYINGKALSFGANDSFSAGYRTVKIANA